MPGSLAASVALHVDVEPSLILAADEFPETAKEQEKKWVELGMHDFQ